MTTTYNITEIHYHLAEDGDHDEFDSAEYEPTSKAWFEDLLPHISNSSNGEDAYDISEAFGDDEDELRYVTIYRYFDR